MQREAGRALSAHGLPLAYAQMCGPRAWRVALLLKCRIPSCSVAHAPRLHQASLFPFCTICIVLHLVSHHGGYLIVPRFCYHSPVYNFGSFSCKCCKKRGFAAGRTAIRATSSTPPFRGWHLPMLCLIPTLLYKEGWRPKYWCFSTKHLRTLQFYT